jgi:hypothetical protein
MRPQQQNRRMRGRGNNGGGSNNNNNNSNRRGPNPLTRNYESNGPDVKIRGSAQQIAEKYSNLARDAQSAGDRVMAENYLQHAEHYNRIIAAAQAQMPAQQMRDNRDFGDDSDDERDEMENPVAEQQPQPQRGNDGSGPQPVIEGMPVEVEQEVLSSEGSQERHANGTHAVNGAPQEDGGPRRPRRPRRGRSRGEGSPEGQGGSEEGAENETSEITAPAAE